MAAMQDLATHFASSSLRAGETSVVTHLPLHDDLRDGRGALRAGAAAYAVDVSTGLAMGFAVLPQERWVVTTDLDVQLVAPVVEGPLRVESDVVRAGDTTAVATFTLHDEGAGRVVGGGTATGRPFPFEFDRAILDQAIGEVRRHGDPSAPRPDGPLARVLGFRLGEDGTAEVDLGPALLNPWGILHGGVTATLADVAAEATAGSRVAGLLVRYLAPGRVGPVRATPRVVARDGGRALVEVRVEDVGAGRVVALATAGMVADATML
jgi:uncharacterized protein (TIGR00369 family)